MKKVKLLVAGLLFASGATMAQQAPPPKPPTHAQRMEHINSKLKDLSMSADQKKKVEAAYKSFFLSMDKLRGDKPLPPPSPSSPPLPPPVKREDVDKLVKARDAKVKAALTADQFKKYQEVEKTLRAPRREGLPPRGDAPKL